MTAFFGLAVLLLAVALAFLLVPLLRRRSSTADSRDTMNAGIYREQLAELRAERDRGAMDDEAFRRAREELERRVVAESGAAAPVPTATRLLAPAVVLAFLVPLVAGVTYWRVGAVEALHPGATESLQAGGDEKIQDLVDRLWTRMKKTPEDGEGWALLGRSLAALGQHERAVEAYARAAKLLPQDAGVLTDYADALAIARNRNLQGEPMELVKRAIALDPQQLKALALAGAGEFQGGNYAAAVGYWKQVMALLPPDSEFGRQLQPTLEEAQKRAGGSAKPAAKPGKALTGTVSLDPKLAALAAPNDTVFVLARPAEGGRMPLAVARTTVAALPYQFQLDDSMAMAPGTTLSAHKQVVVVARVSKSGQPLAQKGDLEGTSKPVSPTAQGLKIVIGKAVE